MRTRMEWSFVVVIALMGGANLGGGGEARGDSPMFLGGPTHIPKTESLTLPDQLFATSRFRCKGGILAPPALVKGVLYLGSSEGTLYALDLTTGTTPWEFRTTFDLRSSPALDETGVYVGCADGRLYCVDRETGKPTWEIWTEEPVYGSPCVCEGVVYVGSMSGKLYATDASNGGVLWEFQARGGIVSSLAVYEGMVYFGTAGNRICCLSTRDGGLIREMQTRDKVDASPVIADGVVYVGSWAGTMYALDALTGAVVWEYPTAGRPIHSPVAVGPEKAFFGGVDRRLYAVDRQEETTPWRLQASDSIYGAPLLVGNRLCFGDGVGVFWSLSAVDGRGLAQVATRRGRTEQHAYARYDYGAYH